MGKLKINNEVIDYKSELLKQTHVIGVIHTSIEFEGKISSSGILPSYFVRSVSYNIEQCAQSLRVNIFEGKCRVVVYSAPQEIGCTKLNFYLAIFVTGITDKLLDNFEIDIINQFQSNWQKLLMLAISTAVNNPVEATNYGAFLGVKISRLVNSLKNILLHSAIKVSAIVEGNDVFKKEGGVE